MESTPVPEDVLKKNPGVDFHLLAEVERLRLELERLGVQHTESYQLAPALGGTLIRNPEQASEQPFTHRAPEVEESTS